MTKALAILNSMRELELKNELSTSGTDAAIAELEEAMKPKTCEGVNISQTMVNVITSLAVHALDFSTTIIRQRSKYVQNI